MAANHVIILGGGASGVLLSSHLLRADITGTRVTIIEKRPELGAGAAYATNHPEHLLNVRANNMSAFPDDPDHFSHWLRARAGTGLGAGSSETCFAPRHLYRDYLSGLLAPHLRDGRLVCRHEEAISASGSSRGVVVGFASGERIEGDIAVLATGNEGPSLSPEPWRHHGWSDPAQCRIATDAPVVVVGTGLTMVDRVMALLHGGHRGPIMAVSRHGFSPQIHKAVTPLGLDAGDIPFGAPMPTLVRWLRAKAATSRAAGLDWRSTVDALRPHTQALWRCLPADERRRFLRHARPFWDVHRHRIAPDAGEAITLAKSRGQLSIIAAHVVGFEPRGSGGVDVILTHRGSRRPGRLHAEAVFECRGRSPDVTRTDNPLLREVLQSGAARPDPLRLGLDVTQDCALIDAHGRVSGNLYALGPVTSGIFWEVVAIPDIRGQASRLARHIGDIPARSAVLTDLT